MASDLISVRGARCRLGDKGYIALLDQTLEPCSTQKMIDA
jgi:hypothetical protein